MFHVNNGWTVHWLTFHCSFLCKSHTYMQTGWFASMILPHEHAPHCLPFCYMHSAHTWTSCNLLLTQSLDTKKVRRYLNRCSHPLQESSPPSCLKVPFLFRKSRCLRTKMDWVKKKRRGGSRGHCKSRLTHRDFRAEVSLLSCVWLFLVCVFLYTGPVEASPQKRTHAHTQAHA